MTKHRLVKIGLVAVIVVGALVVALMVSTGVSEAQGPGGGGRGQGGTGQGYGAGTMGQGYGRSSSPAQLGTVTRQQSQTSLLTLPAAVPGELPATMIDALTAGLMDEYNAYATYQAVIDQFGAVRPFTSIQAAEAHHIDLLTFLFDRYGVVVPQAQPLASVSQFASLQDACAAGAAAEVANFELYDQWIATAQDYPDIVQIFTTLRDASEFQHLPAFERCAGL